MDLSHLIYFTTVVEEKTLTKAAQRLHITQPALSRAIMRIEQKMGAPLFDRNKKQIILNPRGQEVYNWAKAALEGYEDIMAQIAQERADVQNTLTVGCSGYIYTQPIMLGFRRSAPHILVSDFRFNRFEFPDVIYRPDVDCVLSIKDFAASDLDSIQVYRCPLFVTVSKNHPLAAKKILHLEELKHEKLLISSGETLYNETIEDMYRQIGLKPIIGSRVETSHLVHMIADGIGVSISSAETLRILPKTQKKYAAIPLVDEFCRMEVYLIWRKQKRIKKPVEIFRDYVSQFYIHR